MKSMYTSYLCKINKCKKETILLTEEVEDTLRKGNYISCSHCGSKNIQKQNETDNFKECMDHAAYKRKKGSIRQVRYEKT
ncbi:hypothetical protein CLPUN_08500 [Clostridium puniceum]|uniref:Uncharacterized protein n=1 Tax=Clostridium puniceum TaxID=29367 RepID=A0A1S8TVP4_9CLOT|nr:hypothetical protein [Clostridium puniceum]OOM81806.1 hypothetical protein CLPUN_08500 [Clostridium puniceum]